MERIGVFVCHCGTNIAGTVDVAKVAEELGKVDGVVYSTHYTYMCSSAGQKMIEDHIKDDKLTGVVLCSCSPRMHEKTFRSCAERAGLNPYKVEVANIREQTSWVMKDMEQATEKAIALGKAAIAKTILDTPLIAGETPMTKRALVIGGGIAGITAALDIADAGFPVDIVEKDYTVGGKMAKLDKTFPTLDCASCIVTPKMTEISQNPNIRILSASEVCRVSGYIGNFEIDIKRHPRYVDETKCTGCGACIEKCPNKKVPNAFNLGLNNRKAIDIPFAQAVPKVANIDANYCLHMKGLANGKDNVCGFCEKACAAGAIKFDQKEEIITEKYGAIIVATGYNHISLEKFDEYAYRAQTLYLLLNLNVSVTHLVLQTVTFSALQTEKSLRLSYSFSVSVRAVHLILQRVTSTAQRSVVCILQNTQSLHAIIILIQTVMYSILTFVLLVNFLMSSTAVQLNSMVFITLKVR